MRSLLLGQLLRITGLVRSSPGERGETEQRLDRGLVGPVSRDRCRGIGGGRPELRPSEELDERGRDLARGSFDGQANAGTELDHAPGVELLVASKRQQQKGRTVRERSERCAE